MISPILFFDTRGLTIYLDEHIPAGVYMSCAGHAKRSRRTEPPADRRPPPAEATRGRRDRRTTRPSPAPGLEAPPRAQRGRARGGASRRAAAHLQPPPPAPQGARRVAGAVSPHVGRALQSTRRCPSRPQTKR